MLKVKLIGVGAAGNKAAVDALEAGVIGENSILLINSNIGDVPERYRKNSIVFSDKLSGTGKERNIARSIAIEYLSSPNNKIDTFVEDADLVCIVNSTEGGTGSGAAPILYKYLLNVSNKNVMGFVFTGFEEDSRGLKNTVEFFKEFNEGISLQIISNKSFLPLLGKNKLKAEKMANDEFVRRLPIVNGTALCDSEQNIDKSDLCKLVTTTGYMIVERVDLAVKPRNSGEFNQLLEDMLAETKSLKTNKSVERLGVIINCPEDWRDSVDYSFKVFTEAFGIPYEKFTHVQDYDRTPFVAVIASGLEMPLTEIRDI